MEKGWIPAPLRRLISGAYKAYETHVVKNLDAVLFPCLKNGVNIFEGRAKRMVIISNAVMLEEVPQQLDLSHKEDRTICCTGQLDLPARHHPPDQGRLQGRGQADSGGQV